MPDGLRFCTSDELFDMTGYRQHDKQAEWLAANGYSFDLRGSDGRPNVLVDQVRERQLGAKASGKSKPGPDFRWLRPTG